MMRTSLLVAACALFAANGFAQDKPAEQPNASSKPTPGQPAKAPTKAPLPAANPSENAAETATEDPAVSEPAPAAANAPSPGAAPMQPPANVHSASTPSSGVQLGFSAMAAPTAAPSEVDQAQRTPPREKSLYPGWQAFGGLRGAFVPNAGYDPFSDRDFLGQGSLGFGRTVYTADNISVAGMLYFDGSKQTGSARGEATTLTQYRFTLGPELRLHLLPELYLYARPSAGPLRVAARLEESTTGTALYASEWLLAVDGFAGAAFEVLDASRGSGELRIWLAAEGGYGWTTSMDLKFAAEEDDAAAPQRTASVDLGTYAARGATFRGMVGVSF